MDRLDSMRIFMRVAELGSFAAVARQMDVARSVITRQVAALEARLGVKLIARSTRSLSLTSAGAAYLERCREILRLVEAAETDLNGERQDPRGLIRLSVPLSFGLRHLAPLLTDFHVTYPEVSTEIDFTDRRVNLVEEGLDLAIRISARLDPLDVARQIGSTHLLATASPAYLHRHGEPTHPRELAGRECLLYLPAHQEGWPFLVEGVMETFPVRGRMRANNGDALLEATIRGLGISVQPTFITTAAIEAARYGRSSPAIRCPHSASTPCSPAIATCRSGCGCWSTTWLNGSATARTGKPLVLPAGSLHDRPLW